MATTIRRCSGELEDFEYEFSGGGQQVVLHGEPGLQRGAATLRALARDLPGIEECYLITLQGAEMPESQVHPGLDELLTNFSDIFLMPAGLPSIREHEHAIVLKGEAEPVNVRPYRYPQMQKDEIEKLVGESLVLYGLVLVPFRVRCY